MSSEFNKVIREWNETNDAIVCRIARDTTNIVDVEQLEELKRSDELFLTCGGFTMNEDVVDIRYQKREGFVALSSNETVDAEMQLKIANQLADMDLLLGRQFTTYIVPQNIYYNPVGEIVLAHRGIRYVLPPLELTEVDLFVQVQTVILHVLQDSEWFDVKQTVQQADSFNELKQILQTTLENAQQHKPFEVESKQMIETPKVNNEMHSNQTDANFENAQRKTEDTTHSPINEPKRKIQKNVLYAILLGLVIGIGLTYIVKVIPADKEVSAVESTNALEKKELVKDKSDLKEEMKQEELRNKGYLAALKNDPKQAVASLEKIKNMDNESKPILVENYLKLNTVDALTKAASLDESKQVNVVNRLRGMNREEANQAILKMKSNDKEVQIEQASLKKNDQQVVDLFNKELKDNKRAKQLAYVSYLNLNKPTESVKLAKELKDKNLEIKALKKELEVVKKDKKKKDKKKQIESIEKRIKKLEK